MSKDPEEKRKIILQNARELFSTQGIDHTSVAQIASAAGIAKGLIYYYFHNKEEILTGVIQTISRERVQQLLESFEKYQDNYFLQLLNFLDSYYSLHPTTIPQTLFNYDPTLITQFHKQFTQDTQDILHQFIAEGQQLGYFQMKFPKEMLVMTLEGIFALNQVSSLTARNLLTLVEQSLDFPTRSLQDLYQDDWQIFEDGRLLNGNSDYPTDGHDKCF